MSRRNTSGDDGVITFVAIILLIIFALPIAGLFLVGKTEHKLLGTILIIVGAALWIYMAFL